MTFTHCIFHHSSHEWRDRLGAKDLATEKLSAAAAFLVRREQAWREVEDESASCRRRVHIETDHRPPLGSNGSQNWTNATYVGVVCPMHYDFLPRLMNVLMRYELRVHVMDIHLKPEPEPQPQTEPAHPRLWYVCNFHVYSQHFHRKVSPDHVRALKRDLTALVLLVAKLSAAGDLGGMLSGQPHRLQTHHSWWGESEAWSPACAPAGESNWRKSKTAVFTAVAATAAIKSAANEPAANTTKTR